MFMCRIHLTVGGPVKFYLNSSQESIHYGHIQKQWKTKTRSLKAELGTHWNHLLNVIANSACLECFQNCSWLKFDPGLSWLCFHKGTNPLGYLMKNVFLVGWHIQFGALSNSFNSFPLLWISETCICMNQVPHQNNIDVIVHAVIPDFLLYSSNTNMQVCIS